MSALALTRRERGVRFSVHVQPRASRTEFRGVNNGALRVRLQAPPVDGAANDQLVALLAGSLGVPRRSVRVIAGESARLKVVDVEGVEPADVQRLTTNA
jgi:uncharacterized protein (TIGR00251 family)